MRAVGDCLLSTNVDRTRVFFSFSSLYYTQHTAPQHRTEQHFTFSLTSPNSYIYAKSTQANTTLHHVIMYAPHYAHKHIRVHHHTMHAHLQKRLFISLALLSLSDSNNYTHIFSYSTQVGESCLVLPYPSHPWLIRRCHHMSKVEGRRWIDTVHIDEAVPEFQLTEVIVQMSFGLKLSSVHQACGDSAAN